MKPHSKDSIHIEVRQDQVLLKLFPPGDQFSFLIENQASSIEDQFILTADHIAEGDDGEIV
jgi:hypothetical protein